MAGEPATTMGSDAAVDFTSRIPSHVGDQVSDMTSNMCSPIRERSTGDIEAEQFWAQHRSQQLKSIRELYRSSSGIRGDMLRSTFDAYYPKHQLQRNALSIANKFVNHLPYPGKGLMLWGPSGRGKSHLLKAVCNAALELPEPVCVRYVSCGEIARLVRGDKEYLPELMHCQLLALDDLEKGLAGDAPSWGREALKDIIDRVDSVGRPTLISTSEYPLHSICAENGEVIKKGHDYENRLPDRLVGRLAKLFYWQEVDGPNARLENEDDTPHWAR